MALKTLVKISSVNNLSDARYCAGMGVTALGFDINPNSPGYISPEKFEEITGWVSGVQFVGELNGDISTQNINDLLQNYSLDYIEVSNKQLLPALAAMNVPVVFKLDLSEFSNGEALEELLKSTKSDIKYYLLESSQNSDNQHIINRLLTQSSDYPIFLGVGVTPENVLQLIDSNPIKGIALKGGDEQRPGYRDFDDLADVLEVLEVDE